MRCICLLASVALVWSAQGTAQDAEDSVPPLVVAAEPVDSEAAAETPAADAAPQGQLELLYEEPSLQYESSATLKQQISADLIDIRALRKAVAARRDTRELRMTLDECLRLALVRNPDILISAYEPAKAEADTFSARGQFDPIFQTDITVIDAAQSLSQQEVAFGGISVVETFRTQSVFSVRGQLSLGTIYDLTLNVNRESTTFGQFIEEWDTRLNLTVTQPLLRGFGRDVNLVRIRQAQQSRRASEAQFKLQVMQTVAEVVRAYWDLVGAIENLKVREEALENARRLLRVNETRREIGTAADLDVVQAKTSVAARQGDVASAINIIRNAEDRLKLLLDIRDGAVFSSARIYPIERPAEAPSVLEYVETIDDIVEEGVELAWANRPEIEIGQIEIANSELEETRTGNEMLPQLDVFASKAQGGRSTDRTRAFTGIRESQDDAITYGLQGSISLGNRSARGQFERARLNTRQSEQRLEQTRQQLAASVHQAARAVLENATLVESNRQARQGQEAIVVAEEERLRLGLTTSWQALQVQNDLTAAQVQELQAIINYQKAVIDLELAQGTLLRAYDIVVEPPESAERPGYISSVTPDVVERFAPSWE